MPNVKVQIEGLKDAVIQALLSRGDRRLGRMIIRAAESGGWRRAARDMGLDVEGLVCRSMPLEDILPWDIICCEKRERLAAEYQRAFT